MKLHATKRFVQLRTILTPIILLSGAVEASEPSGQGDPLFSDLPKDIRDKIREDKALHEQFEKAEKNLKASELTNDNVEIYKHLGKVNLYVDKADDDTMALIGKLKNLISLDFGNIEIASDEGLKHLSGLEELEYLDLYGTQVTDEGLQYLSNLKNLKILNLVNTKVKGEGLKHISELKNLAVLYLNSTGTTDKDLHNLSGLKNLEAIELKGSNVTDEGVAELKKSLPNTRITLK